MSVRIRSESEGQEVNLKDRNSVERSGNECEEKKGRE